MLLTSGVIFGLAQVGAGGGFAVLPVCEELDIGFVPWIVLGFRTTDGR